MAETQLQHHEDHDPTVHHEDSDVNVRAILWFTAIFIVLAIVIHVGLWFLLKGLRAYEASREVTPVTEIPLTPDRQIPPQPRLQPFPEPARPADLTEGAESRAKQEGPQLESNFMNPWVLTPAADWREYKAAYDEKVNGYGWIDRNRGIVHIPIEEAKRRLVRQGLNSRSALPAATEATPVQQDEAEAPEGAANAATGFAAANEPAAAAGEGRNQTPASPAQIAPATPAAATPPAQDEPQTPVQQDTPTSTTQPNGAAPVQEPGR